MTTTLIGHELHHDLLDHLKAVDQRWPDTGQATISTLNTREVLVRLTELRDSLNDHFAVEEDHGLLPDGSTSDPQFEDKESALLKQHAGLRERLNAVIASVPVNSERVSGWASAKKHFDEFRKELQTHECAEIELIQTEFRDGPGTGD